MNQSFAVLQDDYESMWEDLLDLVVRGQVVPVVGNELLDISPNDGAQNLSQFLAQRLAGQFQTPSEALGESPDLNELGSFYFRGRRRDVENMKRRVQRHILEILNEEPPAVPETLKQLAEITDFRLLLSTTPDNLLLQAVRDQRQAIDQEVTQLTYYRHHEKQDLPSSELSDIRETTIFRLFGSYGRDFALTDEQVLERLYDLQSRRGPVNLFSVLQDKSLLLLGCGFPDGITRLLLRELAAERLRCSENIYTIADKKAVQNRDLVVFLRSCEMYLFPELEPKKFVAELLKRWRSWPRFDAPALEAVPVAEASETAPIFLSYQSEDRDRVLQFRDVIESENLGVWFDQKELNYGDNWKHEIRNGVRKCLLFMPFISSNSVRPEGFFREEWKQALERNRRIDETMPFLVPVALDDIERSEAGVPEQFWSRQVVRFPNGSPTREFIDKLKACVRTAQERRAGL